VGEPQGRCSLSARGKLCLSDAECFYPTNLACSRDTLRCVPKGTRSKGECQLIANTTSNATPTETPNSGGGGGLGPFTVVIVLAVVIGSLVISLGAFLIWKVRRWRKAGKGTNTNPDPTKEAPNGSSVWWPGVNGQDGSDSGQSQRPGLSNSNALTQIVSSGGASGGGGAIASVQPPPSVTAVHHRDEKAAWPLQQYSVSDGPQLAAASVGGKVRPHLEGASSGSTSLLDGSTINNDERAYHHASDDDHYARYQGPMLRKMPSDSDMAQRMPKPFGVQSDVPSSRLGERRKSLSNSPARKLESNARLDDFGTPIQASVHNGTPTLDFGDDELGLDRSRFESSPQYESRPPTYVSDGEEKMGTMEYMSPLMAGLQATAMSRSASDSVALRPAGSPPGSYYHPGSRPISPFAAHTRDGHQYADAFNPFAAGDRIITTLPPSHQWPASDEYSRSSSPAASPALGLAYNYNMDDVREGSPPGPGPRGFFPPPSVLGAFSDTTSIRSNVTEDVSRMNFSSYHQQYMPHYYNHNHNLNEHVYPTPTPSEHHPPPPTTTMPMTSPATTAMEADEQSVDEAMTPTLMVPSLKDIMQKPPADTSA
ncbi:hypothetical protein HK102_002155, partial [Quaeritorhiza haematococci]